MEMNFNSKENKIGVDIFFLIYLNICNIALIICYLRYLISINFNVAFLIALLFSIFISLFLYYKNVFYLENFFVKSDVFIITILTFFMLLRLPFSDFSWDTLNYHIYAQEMFGRDFINYDFFPQRAINAVSLVLGDQICYIFRHFLGYRLGTIITFFSVVVIYFQLKKIIKILLEEVNININNLIISVIALISLFVENVIWSFDCYYIDILAVPLMLQCLILILHFNSSNKNYIIFFAVLGGFAASIKLSNAYVLLLFGIVVLITMRKSLTIKNILLSTIIVIFQLGIYLWESFRLTGNPLFPYANSIFKSNYFTITESVNDRAAFNIRFGATSLWQYIIWPIYSFFNPLRTTDNGYSSGRGACIFLGIFILTLFLLINRKKVFFNKKINVYFLITLIMYFLSITVYHGYLRYVIIYEIIATLLLFFILCYIIKNSMKGAVLIGTITIILFAYQSVNLAITYATTSLENGCRGTFFTSFDDFLDNINYILKDRNSGIEKQSIEDIDAWLLVNSCASDYETLIKPEVPMIIMPDYYTLTNEYVTNMYYDRLNIYKDKNIYAVADSRSIESTLNLLNQNGFIVTGIKNISPYFADANSGLILIKVKQSSEFKTEVQQGFHENFIVPINSNGQDYKKEIYIGINALSKNFNECKFKVYICNLNNQPDKLLIESNINYFSNFLKLNLNISKEEINENTCIYVEKASLSEMDIKSIKFQMFLVGNNDE